MEKRKNPTMAGQARLAALALFGLHALATLPSSCGFAIKVDAHEEECFFEDTTTGTKVELRLSLERDNFAVSFDLAQRYLLQPVDKNDRCSLASRIRARMFAFRKLEPHHGVEAPIFLSVRACQAVPCPILPPLSAPGPPWGMWDSLRLTMLRRAQMGLNFQVAEGGFLDIDVMVSIIV